MTRNTRVPRLCKRKSPSTGKTLAYATFNGKTVSFGGQASRVTWRHCWSNASRLEPSENARMAAADCPTQKSLIQAGRCSFHMGELAFNASARRLANSISASKSTPYDLGLSGGRQSSETGSAIKVPSSCLAAARASSVFPAPAGPDMAM